METPPPTPDAKPPLSLAFFITLFAPIASMAVAAACSAIGGRNSDLQGFGLLLSMATLVAMLVCSIVCAVMVGKRSGGGIGVRHGDRGVEFSLTHLSWFSLRKLFSSAPSPAARCATRSVRGRFGKSGMRSSSG
jgi:hypothetical protein